MFNASSGVTLARSWEQGNPELADVLEKSRSPEKSGFFYLLSR
jgi:hypothetical protein